MASFESLIKMINQRARSIYDYFTPNSTEYMKVKSIIFSYLGNEDFLIREMEGKAVSVSRSKKAMQAFYSMEDVLPDIWEKLQKLGTVKKLASNYEMYDEQTEKLVNIGSNFKEADIMEAIREETKRAYKAEYADTDLYAKLTDEISEQAQIPRAERDADYWQALRAAYDLLHTKGMSIDQKVSRAWGIFNEAKLAHEEWLEKHVARSGRDYDLGGND